MLTGRPMRLMLRTRGVLEAAGLAAFILLFALGYAAAAGDELPTSPMAHSRELDQLYAKFAKSFPRAATITVAQLQDAARTGSVQIVDAREGVERDVSMIPGAISREDFQRNLERFRHGQVVTYCTVGYRSGLYAQDLADQGIPAQNLKGGILAWVDAGGGVVGTNGPTRRVHVYSRRWKELLAPGYAPVW